MKWIAIPFIILALFGIPVFIVAFLAALDGSWFDGWTAFNLIWPNVVWSFLLWSWWITRPQRGK